MTHEEKRVWLIRELLSERVEYRRYGIPDNEQEQKNLLRSLMNVRKPGTISDEFLQIQDEYLQAENAGDGFISIDDLEPVKMDKRLYLWQGDITRLKIDAIVNAANSGLTGCYQPLHGCIDNIIHSKAGIQLRYECNRIMKEQGHAEPAGQAKITPGYNLPCKYVVHTVGPVAAMGLTEELKEQLSSCYRSCLELAEKNDIKSMAFCCISTGVFMFPNQTAAEIAVKTVKNYLDETGSDIKVLFNVFKDQDLVIYRGLVDK